MGRKIKHYSSGYQIKRKKQKRLISGALFALMLIVLVFVGYIGAKAVSELTAPSDGDLSGLSDSLSLPDDSAPGSLEESLGSSEPEGESEDTSLPESSLESEEPSSEVESLYSQYGVPTVTYTPVKENLFTLYGDPVAVYSPQQDLPAPADDGAFQAVTMPLETALSLDSARTFLDGLDQTVYNAVVVPVKDSEGILYYNTGVSLAYTCGAVSSSRIDLEELVSMIESYGFKPAASIYSLEDPTASHARYGTSYLWTDDGVTTWLDAKPVNGGKPWLNPYADATVNYLTSIAAELDQLGFVDLVVYGNQYPNSTLQQKMGLGDTGGVSKVDQLQAVLQSMQNAASGLRVIPAYQGACYTEGVNTQVYTTTPNTFTFTPSAPIIGSDLSILDRVTADPSTVMPVIDSEDLVSSLSERGITSYIVSN